MKKIILGFLVLSSSTLFAATATNLTQNWICTTNASSSSVAADKNADKKMADTKSAVSSSFLYAEKNCRDCTKITCEVQN